MESECIVAINATAHDDAIEAAWKAIPDDPEVEHMDIAARVVDAVEPIIRADERAKVWGETFLPEVHVARIEADLRERLRAQVEALLHDRKCDTLDPAYGGRGKVMCTCWHADVLRLLGGDS